MTLAALDGTRQRAPSGCTAPESDLDQEPLAQNLIGKTERLFDRDGCPIRNDIANMKIAPDDHHCWPRVGFVSIGTPLGTTQDASGTRFYVRAYLLGQLGDLQLAPLDLDADPSLDRRSIRAGRRMAERIWIDEADDRFVYVFTDDVYEAWPRLEQGLGCA